LSLAVTPLMSGAGTAEPQLVARALGQAMLGGVVTCSTVMVTVAGLELVGRRGRMK